MTFKRIKKVKAAIDKVLHYQLLTKWPRTKKVASITAKTISFPLLNKRKIRILLATTMLTPFASYLFPSGTHTLKKEGLPPAITQEIAPGQKIRVEEGFAAVLLDVKTLIPYNPVPLTIIPFNLISNYLLANADSRQPSLFNQSGNCIVNMHDIHRFTPEEFISAASGFYILPRDIKNVPISKKELYDYILLHEMRHCGQSISMPASQREGDADFYAMTIAVRELKNPEIIRFVFNLRAVQKPVKEGHDMSLYLDARLNNRPIPTAAEIRAANEEAASFLMSTSDDCSTLSPLSRKRVEFYGAAARYFILPPVKKPGHAGPGIC